MYTEYIIDTKMRERKKHPNNLKTLTKTLLAEQKTIIYGYRLQQSIVLSDNGSVEVDIRFMKTRMYKFELRR